MKEKLFIGTAKEPEARKQWHISINQNLLACSTIHTVCNCYHFEVLTTDQFQTPNVIRVQDKSSIQ